MNENQELRSLKRGLKVLALLNETENVSITELARYLKLPRTTAERILLTLLAEGYVHRIPDDKRYRLSSRVCTLSDGFSEDCRVVQTATPLLFRLTEQIGWPLAIATPSGDRMILRSTSDPATTLWLHRRRVGAETPMLGCSSGLVAYAFSTPVEQDIMRALLMRSTDSDNCERASDEKRLEILVKPVIENGFAFQPPPKNHPEQSVALPIFSDGRYVASLLMIYMTQAMTNFTVIERYVPHLRNLAKTIGDAVAARTDIDSDIDLGFPAFVAAPAFARGPHVV